LGEGVTQPFMFLLSGHGSESDAESEQIKANIRSIYDREPIDGRLEITIRGTSHYMFSDDGAMLKSPLLKRVLEAFGIVHIDGCRLVAATAHYISTFFDVYLKGAPPSQLQRQPEYSEIEYLP
jgi:hypothetical protein